MATIRGPPSPAAATYRATAVPAGSTATAAPAFVSCSYRRLMRAIRRMESGGDASSDICRRRRASSAAGRSRQRLSQSPQARRCGEVHLDRPADHRGDVEIGDGEIIADEIRLLGERLVEHLERPLDHLERLRELGRIAIFDRQADRMQRPDVDSAIDLVERPKRPLPGLGLGFGRCRIEAAERMLLRQIERDREQLPQDEAVIGDRRQPAIGIDRQEFRSPGAGRPDLERDVLVVDAEFHRHPQRAKGARAGDAVNAQAGHGWPPPLVTLGRLGRRRHPAMPP